MVTCRKVCADKMAVTILPTPGGMKWKLTSNLHAMCKNCAKEQDWNVYQRNDTIAEVCCYCGDFTMGGLYLPLPHVHVPCNSSHGEEEE